jgi:hypothetical protein
MSELGEDLGPEDYIGLLPNNCQRCNFAQFAIGMIFAFEGSVGSPMTLIDDIQERCTGNQEPPSKHPNPPHEIDKQDGQKAPLFDISTLSFRDCPYEKLDES